MLSLMFVVLFSIDQFQVIDHIFISSENELRLGDMICWGSKAGAKTLLISRLSLLIHLLVLHFLILNRTVKRDFFSQNALLTFGEYYIYRPKAKYKCIELLLNRELTSLKCTISFSLILFISNDRTNSLCF